MTAHCRPERHPSQKAMDKASEFVALAVDPAIPYTTAIRRIAEELDHEAEEE